MPSSDAEVVSMEEGVDSGRLVRPNALDQRTGRCGRFAELGRAQPRLADPLERQPALPQAGRRGGARPGRSNRRAPAALRGLSVAMLVLLAGAARTGRVTADRGFDHVPVRIALRKRGLRDVEQRRHARRSPRAAASMSAVSSSPENGSRCWVMKSGNWRKRCRIELDLRPHRAPGSLPRGSRPAAARTAGTPPAYIRRSASSGRSCAGE